MAFSPEEKKLFASLKKVVQFLLGIVLLLIVSLGYFTFDTTYSQRPRAKPVKIAQPKTNSTPAQAQTIKVIDGKDITTGLVAAEGLQVVITNCTRCHSSKLITQNRFTKQGWLEKIRWMQQTQGLWDLGANEPIVLDYLAKNYAPEEIISRRPPLTDIEWYKLEE